MFRRYPIALVAIFSLFVMGYNFTDKSTEVNRSAKSTVKADDQFIVYYDDNIPEDVRLQLALEDKKDGVPVVYAAPVVPVVASAVSELHFVNYNKTQRECLALNIYHEAKNQSDEGQIAVGIVTLNRVVSKKYPATICGVVQQSRKWNGKIIRHKCSFSWYCDGKNDVPKNQSAWDKAQVLADTVLNYYTHADFDVTGGALWYHADYIKAPYWAEDLEVAVVIQNHIFYRKP